MKAFQYLIIHRPKNKNKQEKILTEVKLVLAEDQNSALLRAAREIPEEYLSDLSEVEVAIRPF